MIVIGTVDVYTAGSRRGVLAGLPSPQTRLVGRAAECAAARAALDEARLVTLTGPRGVGKTRLAIAVASLARSAFGSGGAFAELAPVRPDFLAQTIAAAAGVTERPGQPLEAALHERLSAGRCLLVVDNCAPAPGAVAGLIGRLLAGCPQLVVLATSREPLGLTGERVLPVPPLTLAGEVRAGSSGAEAETLFLDRAGRASADPELVRELCSRLHGMPLAIELAAAGAGPPGWAGLRARLGECRRPDGRDPGERQRTLRAVLDWSYELLDDDERRLLRQLAVFVRGFDQDAASWVAAGCDRAAAADLIGRLARKSLLSRDGAAAAGQWRMPGTVRAYALDRLASAAEDPGCRHRHRDWAAGTAAQLERMVEAGQPWRPRFDAVADDLRAALDGAQGQAHAAYRLASAAEDPGGRDTHWAGTAATGAQPGGRAQAAQPGRPRFDAVADDLRAARDGAQGQAHAAHRLARALGRLCYARQFLLEARQHFTRAAACAPDESAAAADLRTAADVAMAEHRGDIAFPLLLESAQRAGSARDDAGQAIALAFAACIGSRFPATFTELVPHERLRRLLAEAKRAAPPADRLAAAYLAAARAWNATGRKTTPDAELAQQALRAARTAGDPVLISAAIDAVTSADGAAGRFRDAHRLSRERIRLFDRLPRHDPRIGLEIIDTLHVTPLVAVAAGDLPGAIAAARRAWQDPLSGLYMRASKHVVPLVLAGRFEEALTFAGAMWDGWQRAGRPAARWMAPAVHAAALAHGLRGQASGWREWRGRAQRMAAPHDPGGISASFAAFADARAALHDGALDDAVAAGVDLSATPAWPRAAHQFFDAYAWAIAAEVAAAAGLPDARDRLAAAAPAGAQSSWAAACLARASGVLHDDRDALRESLAGWERIDARFERACTLLLLPGGAAEGLAELTSLGCAPPAGRGSARRRG